MSIITMNDRILIIITKRLSRHATGQNLCSKNQVKVLQKSLTTTYRLNSEKSSLLSQPCQNPGDRTIVKAKRKGIPGGCQIRQSLEIPLFLGFSELFYLFRDRRTTVSTWLGSPTSNLFKTHCTREWWNTYFRLKMGTSNRYQY